MVTRRSIRSSWTAHPATMVGPDVGFSAQQWAVRAGWLSCMAAGFLLVGTVTNLHTKASAKHHTFAPSVERKQSALSLAVLPTWAKISRRNRGAFTGGRTGGFVKKQKLLNRNLGRASSTRWVCRCSRGVQSTSFVGPVDNHRRNGA